MKEQLINDVLMRMQETLNREQLRQLEQVMMAAMYTVDVLMMETGLSTDLDDNDYMLDSIRFNMQKRDLSARTIEQYMRAAQSFIDTVHKNLRNIEPFDVDYYLSIFAKGKERKNSNTSINNERRFLSAIFTWLKRCNFITSNPVDNVAIRKETKKPIDFLKGVEVEELRAACDQNTQTGRRQRAVLEFLLSTGARVGEVPDIKITDVDFRTGELMLYGHKDREYRTVFLNDAARVYIKRYLDGRTDNSPYLFVGLKAPHTPIRECGLRDVLLGVKEQSPLNRRIYPHLMRKTMASILRQHGASTDDIADLLGHANSQVTRTYYAAATPGQLQTAHRLCMG